MEKRIDAFFENWQQGLCAGGQVLVNGKPTTAWNRSTVYGGSREAEKRII